MRQSMVGFCLFCFAADWRRFSSNRLRREATVGFVGTRAFGVFDASSSNESS